MCNRYRLNASPDELIDLFDLPRDITRHPVSAEFFYPGKPAPSSTSVIEHAHLRR